MSYDVGDILWIIHIDRPGLVAYQVVEEITKKTLEGELVQYLVLPAVPKARAVKLESINGRIFISREEAKQALLENATRAIDAIVDKTQNLVNKLFSRNNTVTTDNSSNHSKQNQKIEKLKEGYQWVQMEDGKRVQVKLPEILK